MDLRDGRIETNVQDAAHARALRSRYHADPWRPTFHFMSPEGFCWAFDPNGPLYYQGRYHLFYLFVNEAMLAADRDNDELEYSWGHASSVDLLHWHYHGTALAPEGNERLIISGGSLIDKDGVPTLFYPCGLGICFAQSCDEDLETWIKYPRPVIVEPKRGDEDYGKYHMGDVAVFRHDETYFALINAGRPDNLFLFRSEDMKNWQYLSKFYDSNLNPMRDWDDCACPDFFPLGDRWVLLFISHYNGAQYYTGTFDGRLFVPECFGKMNWPGGCFFAPETVLDGKGRRIMWGWVPEAIDCLVQRANGWSGVLSMPRILSLSANGEVHVDVPQEFERLRLRACDYGAVNLLDGAVLDLQDLHGNTEEIALMIRVPARGRAGIRLRCAADEQEQTEVYYDSDAHALCIDARRSSLSSAVLQPYPYPWAAKMRNPFGIEPDFPLRAEIKNTLLQVVPYAIAPGETLSIRIFLDRSIVEVFCNREICVTQRIYPTKPDSLGTKLFTAGCDAEFLEVAGWHMAPTVAW